MTNEKVKHGRKPLPEKLKVNKQIPLFFYPEELEAFRKAAGVKPTSHFIREAFMEMMACGETAEDPGPITTELTVPHPILVTKDEKDAIDNAVKALGFKSRNSFIRAVGLWKVKRLRDGTQK